MVFCSAFGCKSHSDRKELGISFHRFPLKFPDKCDKWVANIKRAAEWVPTKNDRLCSKHFESDWFSRRGNKISLLATAVPTLFLEIPGYLQSPQRYGKATKRLNSSNASTSQEIEKIPRKKRTTTSEEVEEVPRKEQATIRHLPYSPVASTLEEGEETPQIKLATESFLFDSLVASNSDESEETPEIKQATESFLSDSLVASNSHQREETPQNVRRLQRKLLHEVEKSKLKSEKIRVLGQKVKRYEKRFTVMKEIIKDLRKQILLISEYY